MILGTITRQGFYDGGKDICEIYISRESRDMLSHACGQRIPIDMIIGNIYYEAGVHETREHVVWISSVLYEKEEGGRGRKARLVDALAQIGLRWRNKVIIKENKDGTFLLEPYNDNTA